MNFIKLEGGNRYDFYKHNTSRKQTQKSCYRNAIEKLHQANNVNLLFFFAFLQKKKFGKNIKNVNYVKKLELSFFQFL